jgi:hypothetical protein
MKVKSFGCSFIYGNDLHDDGHDGAWGTFSRHTWPALIAKKLGFDYGCQAKGGVGNMYILSRLLYHIGEVKPPGHPSGPLFLIGWSWADRFDYMPPDRVRSRDPWDVFRPTTDTEESNFYYRHLHSEPRDKLSSLICMDTAINVLKSKNIPFIMTCIDDLIFDRQWNNTYDISIMQDRVEPYITRFEEKNFLDWSREKGFPISETLHPLESAHAAAADYLLPLAQSITDTTQHRV